MDTSRQIKVTQIVKRSLGLAIPVNNTRTLMKVFIPLSVLNNASHQQTLSSATRKYLMNKLGISINSFTGYLYKENMSTDVQTFYVVQLSFVGILDEKSVNDLIAELDKVRSNLS